MFEALKSKQALRDIIQYNKDKAKHYGERMSLLKSCDYDSEFGMSAIQVNNEMERCNRKMMQCERKIRCAEKYL